jgi:hypothetical protein
MFECPLNLNKAKQVFDQTKLDIANQTKIKLQLNKCLVFIQKGVKINCVVPVIGKLLATELYR